MAGRMLNVPIYSTTYHAVLPHTCMASLNLKHLQILTPKSPDRETPSGHHHISTTAPLSSNNPVPHLISFLIFSAMHFTYFVSSIQKVNFMRVGIFFSFPYHSLLYFQHQEEFWVYHRCSISMCGMRNE